MAKSDAVWGIDIGNAGIKAIRCRPGEDPEQIARAMAQLVLHGLPDDTFDTFVPKVRAISEPQVSGAAARYFDSQTMFTVIVGDRAHVEPGLADAGFSCCTVVEAPAD